MSKRYEMDDVANIYILDEFWAGDDSEPRHTVVCFEDDDYACSCKYNKDQRNFPNRIPMHDVEMIRFMDDGTGRVWFTNADVYSSTHENRIF